MNQKIVKNDAKQFAVDTISGKMTDSIYFTDRDNGMVEIAIKNQTGDAESAQYLLTRETVKELVSWLSILPE